MVKMKLPLNILILAFCSMIFSQWSYGDEVYVKEWYLESLKKDTKPKYFPHNIVFIKSFLKGEVEFYDIDHHEFNQLGHMKTLDPDVFMNFSKSINSRRGQRKLLLTKTIWITLENIMHY